MSENSDFYAATRWPLALNDQVPVFHDRVEADGVPYRGPRETWSEEQYERHTHQVSDFQNRWFNLFDEKDLDLYRKVMAMVARRQAVIRHEERKETVLPRSRPGPDDEPPVQWVYLEWIERWMQQRPNAETIQDLGAPPPPDRMFR
jgi:hypothetical protein